MLSSLTLLCSVAMFGQGANNIVISEVMTSNTQSIEDEFGHREAWVELANTSFSTYNVRGMYLTTNSKVLDESLSAPQRIAMMSVIPNGDDRTSLGARHYLMLYCNSDPAQGKLHLSLPVDSTGSVFLALYNANGVDLIDSVTVPVLGANESYARIDGQWKVCGVGKATPGHDNSVQTNAAKGKIEQFKDKDPHGFENKNYITYIDLLTNLHSDICNGTRQRCLYGTTCTWGSLRSRSLRGNCGFGRSRLRCLNLWSIHRGMLGRINGLLQFHFKGNTININLGDVAFYFGDFYFVVNAFNFILILVHGV